VPAGTQVAFRLANGAPAARICFFRRGMRDKTPEKLERELME
jgi:hypothetical protein